MQHLSLSFSPVTPPLTCLNQWIWVEWSVGEIRQSRIDWIDLIDWFVWFVWFVLIHLIDWLIDRLIDWMIDQREGEELLIGNEYLFVIGISGDICYIANHSVYFFPARCIICRCRCKSVNPCAVCIPNPEFILFFLLKLFGMGWDGHGDNDCLLVTEIKYLPWSKQPAHVEYVGICGNMWNMWNMWNISRTVHLCRAGAGQVQGQLRAPSLRRSRRRKLYPTCRPSLLHDKHDGLPLWDCVG